MQKRQSKTWMGLWCVDQEYASSMHVNEVLVVVVADMGEVEACQISSAIIVVGSDI